MSREVKITTEFINAFKKILTDQYGSYRSWEYCYNYFGKRNLDKNIAALYLIQYLAAFGMLRASGNLFKKNYRIFYDPIDIIQNHKQLRGINASKVLENVSNIEELRKELRSSLIGKSFMPTETLVTKILLGTLACVPAYDRNFKDGIKYFDIKKNLAEIISRFESKKIHEIRNKLQLRSKNYPDMRIIDIFFWHKGKTLNDQKKPKTTAQR